MSNKNISELLNSLPVGVDTILQTMCEHFNACYILDLKNNCIITLRQYQNISNEKLEQLSNWKNNWNDNFKQITDSIVDEIYHEKVYDFFNPATIKNSFTSLEQQKEFLYCLYNGRWQKAVLHPLELKDGQTLQALLLIIDNTEMELQFQQFISDNQSLQQQANRYKMLFFHAAMDTYDYIVQANLSSNKVVRLQIENGMIVESPQNINWNSYYNQLIAEIHPDDRTQVIMKTHPSVLDNAPEGHKIHFSYRQTDHIQSGKHRCYSATLHITFDNNHNRIATIFFIDNTEYLEERTKLKTLSERDELTYLYNRNKLDEMMNTQYANIDSCGILFFDVNNLKTVNDTFGHAEGDKLICLAAESIRSVTTRNIEAYRYGGDEFIIVTMNGNASDLDTLIMLWRERLEKLVSDSNIPCSIAVGKAWSAKPFSLQELILKADTDMYANKKIMKNQ